MAKSQAGKVSLPMVLGVCGLPSLASGRNQQIIEAAGSSRIVTKLSRRLLGRAIMREPRVSGQARRVRMSHAFSCRNEVQSR